MSIDHIPAWLFFLGTILIVIASIEGGFRLGVSVRRRSEDEKESPVSAITGAVLGLGAFLLAFTFGIVSDRYDSRKGLVRDEANAIRTAWLRSEFLPEPDQKETKVLLKEYVDVRLALVLEGNFDEQRLVKVGSRVEQITARLWEMAVLNARKDMNSDVAALYIEALNEVFSIRALRVAIGLQARIPTGIWLTLIAITVLGMMGVGYQTGIAGSKRSMSVPLLALAFAMVITLIASLDRPDGSIIGVTQRPLVDLQTWMSKDAAVAGARPVTSQPSASMINTPALHSRNSGVYDPPHSAAGSDGNVAASSHARC